MKFLNNDNRFTYIASGSLLGIAKTISIPMGSISILEMFPQDFEEFLHANGFNEYAVNLLKDKFSNKLSLDESIHNKLLNLFKKYLITGGLPDSINSYLSDFNITKIRQIQSEIYDFYASDASQYDKENKLKIKRIYQMFPSNLENKKKRVIIQNIENIKGKKAADYFEEFDYLINSGIALEVKAISTPVFPLIESSGKNLLKLYLNDVGILTSILYKNNANAIFNNERSINLGTVYESVVASELIAHGHKLYYYDNRNNGEIDFLIDDYENLSTLPIEVKSGKDYTIHSALTKFLKNPDYKVKKAYVLSNERNIIMKGNIIYIPIYFVMFI